MPTLLECAKSRLSSTTTIERNYTYTLYLFSEPDYSKHNYGHLAYWDWQLSKYGPLNNFESQTSVPKVYVVLGLAALYFFLVFFNIAGGFLVNIAGFVIPGYYSLEALFSVSKTDDTQVCWSWKQCSRHI